MSEAGGGTTWFRSPAGAVAVALPFDLERVVADWESLRVPMTRHVPEVFQRDEWAYLIRFLERDSLMEPFRSSFGEPIAAPGDLAPVALARPGGPVAVWLPNNVSLLGPLALVLLTLTGNPLLLKGGSQSEDLCGAFLDFARANLSPGHLSRRLESVRFEVFDRDDPRNAEYAAAARLRIVFGSDAAAEAVDALPHPLDSSSCAFVDRRSEAWVAPARVDDALLRTLVKVFAVYGQAGCTSPRRVVLLDGGSNDARALRDGLVAAWPHAVQGEVAPHVASSNVMARQWAAALGWDAVLAPANAAVLAVGTSDLERFDAPMALPIVAAPLERAAAELPDNIQTIGHAFAEAGESSWGRCLELLSRPGAKRFVPLARMHHFGPVWDGVDYWRRTFEHVEIAP